MLGYNVAPDFPIIGKLNQYIHVSRQFPARMAAVVQFGLQIVVKPRGSLLRFNLIGSVLIRKTNSVGLERGANSSA